MEMKLTREITITTEHETLLNLEGDSSYVYVINKSPL